MKKAVIAIAILALSGCSAIINEGIERRVEFNDQKARVLKHAPCDMSVGAMLRTTTAEERAAIMTLCPGGGV